MQQFACEPSRDALSETAHAPLSPDELVSASPEVIIQAARDRHLIGEEVLSIAGYHDPEDFLAVARQNLHEALLRHDLNACDSSLHGCLSRMDADRWTSSQLVVTHMATADNLHFDTQGRPGNLASYLRSHYAPLVHAGLHISIAEKPAHVALKHHAELLHLHPALVDNTIASDIVAHAHDTTHVPVLTISFHGTVKHIPILHGVHFAMEPELLGCFVKCNALNSNDTDFETILINPTCILEAPDEPPYSLPELSSMIVHEIDHAIVSLVQQTSERREIDAATSRHRLLQTVRGPLGSSYHEEALTRKIESIRNARAHSARNRPLMVLEGLATESERAYVCAQAAGLNPYVHQSNTDAPNLGFQSGDMINAYTRNAYNRNTNQPEYGVGGTLVGLAYAPEHMQRLYMTDVLEQAIINRPDLVHAMQQAVRPTDQMAA